GARLAERIPRRPRVVRSGRNIYDDSPARLVLPGMRKGNDIVALRRREAASGPTDEQLDRALPVLDGDRMALAVVVRPGTDNSGNLLVGLAGGESHGSGDGEQQCPGCGRPKGAGPHDREIRSGHLHVLICGRSIEYESEVAVIGGRARLFFAGRPVDAVEP